MIKDKYPKGVQCDKHPNSKSKKKLSDGFKTSFDGNKYKLNFNVDKDHAVNNMNKIRGTFDSSFQSVKRLCACSYNDTDDNGGVFYYQKYFFQRVNIEHGK